MFQYARKDIFAQLTFSTHDTSIQLRLRNVNLIADRAFYTIRFIEKPKNKFKGFDNGINTVTIENAPPAKVGITIFAGGVFFCLYHPIHVVKTTFRAENGIYDVYLL